jgi:hypothetical protein
MTLLAICQDAAIEIGGFDVPNTIVGNTDINARRLLRAAQRVGSDLVTRAAWSVLRTQATFTAVPGEAQPGTVPSDFDRMIPETLWDRTNRMLIAGPVPSARWQSLTATWPGNGPDRWFTLRGTAIAIFPGMQGGEAMAYEYVSRNFCETAAGIDQPRWSADTDVERLPSEVFTLGVVAFFLQAQGLPYADQMAAYEARVVRSLANDDPASGVLSSGDLFGGQRNWTGTPSAGWGIW